MISPLLVLQVSALLIPVAGSGVVAIVPRLAEVHAIPAGQVSLAITVYMIPFAITQFFVGGVTHRFSVRQAVAFGYATFIAGVIGCAAAPNFASFLLFRLVQGLGAAFLFPVFMALVAEVVPAARLGRAFGAFQSAQMLGMAIGPLLAGFLEVWLGWRSFFVALGVFALLGAAGFFHSIPIRRAPATRSVGIVAVTARVIRQRPVVWLSLAGAGLFFAVVGTNTYLAVWLRVRHGLSADTIGAVLAVLGAVGMLVAPVAGRFGDALGRKRLALTGLIAYAAAVIALGIVPYSLALVVALMAVLGASATTAWTSMGALVVDLVPELRQPVTSVYNGSRFLGYSLAPPLLGLLYADGDLLRVCLGTAVVVLASAGFVAALGKR